MRIKGTLKTLKTTNLNLTKLFLIILTKIAHYDEKIRRKETRKDTGKETRKETRKDTGKDTEKGGI